MTHIHICEDLTYVICKSVRMCVCMRTHTHTHTHGHAHTHKYEALVYCQVWHLINFY